MPATPPGSCATVTAAQITTAHRMSDMSLRRVTLDQELSDAGSLASRGQFDSHRAVQIPFVPELMSWRGGIASVLMFVGGAIGVGVAQNCVPPPAGLVAWWTADGEATDLLGSHDGTLENGAGF